MHCMCHYVPVKFFYVFLIRRTAKLHLCCRHDRQQAGSTRSSCGQWQLHRVSLAAQHASCLLENGFTSKAVVGDASCIQKIMTSGPQAAFLLKSSTSLVVLDLFQCRRSNPGTEAAQSLGPDLLQGEGSDLIRQATQTPIDEATERYASILRRWCH